MNSRYLVLNFKETNFTNVCLELPICVNTRIWFGYVPQEVTYELADGSINRLFNEPIYLTSEHLLTEVE